MYQIINISNCPPPYHKVQINRYDSVLAMKYKYLLNRKYFMNPIKIFMLCFENALRRKTMTNYQG